MATNHQNRDVSPQKTHGGKKLSAEAKNKQETAEPKVMSVFLGDNKQIPSGYD